MLNQIVTVLILISCLAACGKPAKPLIKHELTAVIYVDSQRGDPFGGKIEVVSERVGELGSARMIADVFEQLDGSKKHRSPIPSMGVVARLDFIGETEEMIATARIYLPQGLLVLGSDETKAGRFPKLNSAVVDLLKEKKPDYIAEIDEALRSHGYSLLNLTSSEQSDEMSKPTAKP